MDTELYIVGKDVAELKISKKFRFEKISSDFKMSILLYGNIYGTILLFGIVLQKTVISGQLPVFISESFPETSKMFRSWTWSKSKLENTFTKVTVPALGTDWAKSDWHDKQNEVSFVTIDIPCTDNPANIWNAKEGFQFYFLIGCKFPQISTILKTVLSAKLSGAVPVLCETVYEGFLNVMAEYDTGPGQGLLSLATQHYTVYFISQILVMNTEI